MTEIGKWNKLPHYRIVGDATSFYLWINKDGKGGNTEWIRGKNAFRLYNKLVTVKSKHEFIELFEQAYQENILKY